MALSLLRGRACTSSAVGPENCRTDTGSIISFTEIAPTARFWPFAGNRPHSGTAPRAGVRVSSNETSRIGLIIASSDQQESRLPDPEISQTTAATVADKSPERVQWDCLKNYSVAWAKD